MHGIDMCILYTDIVVVESHIIIHRQRRSVLHTHIRLLQVSYDWSQKEKH